MNVLMRRRDMIEVPSGGTHNTGYVSIGNPTITNGILYIGEREFIRTTEVFSPGDSTWSVTCKHKRTGSDGSTYKDFYGSVNANGNSERGLLLEASSSTAERVSMFLSSNGTSWDIIGTNPVVSMGDRAKTDWVWTKISFTGTEYKFEYSFDGQTYTVGTTQSSTAKIKEGYYVGYGLYRNHNFDGIIDLSECKIYIDGNLWWSAL